MPPIAAFPFVFTEKDYDAQCCQPWDFIPRSWDFFGTLGFSWDFYFKNKTLGFFLGFFRILKIIAAKRQRGSTLFLTSHEVLAFSCPVPGRVIYSRNLDFAVEMSANPGEN